MRSGNYLLMVIIFMLASPLQANEMVRFFKLEVNPSHQQALDDVGMENLSKSVQNEIGTLSMYFTKDKANPNNNYVVEVYKDIDAYKVHTKSEQFAHFVTVAKDAILRREVIDVTPVFLTEQAPALKRMDDPNLLINLVEVIVDPQKNEQYRAIVLPEMQLTIDNEPSVLVMYAVTHKSEPNRWLFFEIYASDEAYQNHRQQPYFIDYLERTSGLVVDKSFVQLQSGVLMNKGGLRILEGTN